jgi:hypothetical protein
MADLTLAAASLATALGGTERLAGLQSGGDVAITPPLLAQYAAGSVYLTAAFQPLDADLISLAGLGGTNTIYYRSGAGTWSAVTVGSGLNFSGGSLTATGGGGDMVSTNNLSDLTNFVTARSNLGVAIGVNVQAYDADLSAIAGLTSAANKIPYFTGSGTAGLLNTSDFRKAAPVPSGQYVYPEFGGGVPAAGTAPGADTLKMFLGYVRADMTINALSVRVSTLFSSGNIKAAIYAMDATTGWPTGAPLVTSAAMSTTTAIAVVDSTVSYTIAAGWYWFATLVDNATAVFFTIPAGAANALTGAASQTNVSGANGLTKASVTYAGGFPTLTGVKATDGLSDNTTTTMPAISFKH